MTKTDAQLAELDRLVDRTATDAATGRQIKAAARRVARAAIQDVSARAAQIRVQNADSGKTPSGVKILSYGDNR